MAPKGKEKKRWHLLALARWRESRKVASNSFSPWTVSLQAPATLAQHFKIRKCATFTQKGTFQRTASALALDQVSRHTVPLRDSVCHSPVGLVDRCPDGLQS